MARLILAMALWAAAATAQAQSNLGELLDKGGKRLNGDEVRAALSGATLMGKTISGYDSTTTYTADGKLAGKVHGPGDWASSGTWRTDPDGKTCGEVYVEVPPTGMSTRGCAYYFRLGEKLYFALSDADRGARVLERTVKR